MVPWLLLLAACSDYELVGESETTCTPGAEVCNGLDDDCDQLVDEDLDADLDGVADCFDTETCDGLDNDGDGEVDEGFDADTDGTPDCDDVEGCDGVDNDGDGVVDEDCPVEACNGIDDDADGDVDEGFDHDGDGVARCCTPADHVFYYPTAPPFTSVEGRRSNGDGTFRPGAPLDAVSAPDLRALVLAHVDEDAERDLLWYRVSDRATFTTTCKDGEWQTRERGVLADGPSAWGDVDADGCLDYVSYDYPASTYGDSGTGEGTTFLGACDGTFTALADPTFDVTFLAGNWTGGTAHDLADWDGDGHVDLFFWAVSSGGASPSSLWYLPGDGQGAFGDAVSLPSLDQAGNSGALGDVDGDGCVDWVNGGNDDGHAASVHAVLGDCAGGSDGRLLLVDPEAWATSQGESTYGDGSSRLWDFDGDTDLDLVTSFNQLQGGPAAILYWENDGAGGFADDPSEVIVPMWDVTSTGFVVPLRP